jgi:Protein of unknown function (DUF2505)
MATKLSLEHRFSKGVDKVWAMYNDKDFFVKKYRENGFTNIEVLDYKKNDQGFSITVRYDAQSDAPLPEFAKKFMASTITVTQTDSWEFASKTGKIITEVKGMPMKVSADMKLEAAGKGAVNKMVWTLSAGIPLIGGKLEGLLAEDQAASAKLLEAY